LSARTFRRWRDRYDEESLAVLLDRRIGKASGKRVPADRAEEVEALLPASATRASRQALPRASGEGPRLWLMATPGRSCICNGRAGSESAAQGSASEEARAVRQKPRPCDTNTIFLSIFQNLGIVTSSGPKRPCTRRVSQVSHGRVDCSQARAADEAQAEHRDGVRAGGGAQAGQGRNKKWP